MKEKYANLMIREPRNGHQREKNETEVSQVECFTFKEQRADKNQPNS